MNLQAVCQRWLKFEARNPYRRRRAIYQSRFKIAGWEKLKTLVLHSVSSPITKRAYNMALGEFLAWFFSRHLDPASLRPPLAHGGYPSRGAVSGPRRSSYATHVGHSQACRWLTTPEPLRACETEPASPYFLLRPPAIRIGGTNFRPHPTARWSLVHCRSRW